MNWLYSAQNDILSSKQKKQIRMQPDVIYATDGLIGEEK